MQMLEVTAQSHQPSGSSQYVLWHGPHCMLVTSQWLEINNEQYTQTVSFLKYLDPLAKALKQDPTLADLFRSTLAELGEKGTHRLDITKLMTRVVSHLKEGYFAFIALENTNDLVSDTITNSYRTTKINNKPQIEKKHSNNVGRLFNELASPNHEDHRTEGYNVSAISGEVVIQQQDFRLRGLIPFGLYRCYRSSSDKDFGLGVGWNASWLARLEINESNISYLAGDGRQIIFEHLSQDQCCVNKIEKVSLHCEEPSLYRIVNKNRDVFIFSGSGKRKRLLEIENATGHNIKFYYNATNKLIYIVDSAQRRLKLEYNITNRVRSITLCDDNGTVLGKPLVQYGYSNQGDLVKITDANGNAQKFEYRDHILTKFTNKDGFEHQYQWDQYNNNAKCLRNWGSENAYSFEFKYNPENKITHCKNGEGDTTIYYYNDLGLVTKTLDPLDGAYNNVYNTYGNLLRTTDPLGNTTRYFYKNDRLVRITNALGHTTLCKYDRDGNLTQYFDAVGQQWQRKYDLWGRVTEITSPDHKTTQYTYDDLGLLSSIVDNQDKKQFFEWNDRGELVRHIDYHGVSRNYLYDDLSRVICTKVNGGNETRYFYDGNDNISQLFLPDGCSMQMQYSPEGHLCRIVDGVGRTSLFEYDGLGQITTRTNPDGHSTKYRYNKNGALVELTNENGDCYRLEYDKNQRLVKETGFDGHVQHYSYNAVGHLICHIDGSSRVIQYKRDALGQILQKWSSDRDMSRFEYDPLCRITWAANQHSEVFFRYDVHGHITEEIQNGLRVKHQYDISGKKIATVMPSGNTIHFHYNKQHLLTQTVYNDKILDNISHNSLGLESARTRGMVNTETTYNPAGRIKHRHIMKDKHLLAEHHYKYDKAGNLSLISDLPNGKTKFYYDEMDRLSLVNGVTEAKYTYDPAGNLLDEKYLGSDYSVKGNRLQIYKDYRLEYDEIGNLIVEKNSDSETRFAYNAHNQLIAVEKNNQITKYYYDALSRRIKKKNRSGESNFLWDGDRLIGEQGKNYHIHYVYEPNKSIPSAQIVDGESFYFHNDPRGTPQLITDSSGIIVWQANFSVFGELLSHVKQKIPNDIGFESRFFDQESGLYYHCGQYYHPTLNRAIQQISNHSLFSRYINPYLSDPANHNRCHEFTPRPATEQAPYIYSKKDQPPQVWPLKHETAHCMNPFDECPTKQMLAKFIFHPIKII